MWSDDFENYNIGVLTNGQGGWNVTNVDSDLKIISESGKGKVLAWGWNLLPPTNVINSKFNRNIQNSWKTRTAGNDVLKLEFDFNAKAFTNSPDGIFHSDVTFYPTTGTVFNCAVSKIGSEIRSPNTYPPVRYDTPYNNTWINVEIYIEYNAITKTLYKYTYVPVLNLTAIDVITNRNVFVDELLIFSGLQAPKHSYDGPLIKYDNFRLSAIPTRPSHLNINELVSLEFDVFPNPTTNFINITSNENMQVNQVTIYDIAGKEIKNQTFTNENQVQLNVENLASGTYMLHVQTNEGLAVKKLVKK